MSTCLRCSAGRTSSSGESSCSVCEAGRYSADGSACLRCPSNTFTSEPGSAACSMCPPGTITLGSSTEHSSCTPCDYGQYWHSTLRRCTPSPLGTYVNERGAVTPTQCPAGRFGNTTSLTICHTCVGGRYSSLGASVCEPCSIGRFSPAESGECAACPSNSYTTEPGQSSCSLCPRGTRRGSGTDPSQLCVPCSPGTYSSDEGSDTCVECPPGSITPTPGLSACVTCELGSLAPRHGMSVCDSCLIGKYSDNPTASACLNCQGGRHAPSSHLSSCIDCPPGRARDMMDGSTACRDCSAGTFTAKPGLSTCTPCGIGRFSLNRATTCQACSPGKFNPVPGQSMCNNCTAGTVALVGLTAQCVSCIPGFYQPDEGMLTCLPCEAGTYSVDPASTSCERCEIGRFSAAGQSQCVPCNVGMFNNDTSMTHCFDCPAGKHMNETGRSSCYSCPDGSSSNARSEVCNPCSKGRYSVGETPICTNCDQGKYSLIGGATACLNCSAGTVQPNTGEAACVTCDAGYAAPYEGRTACVPCPPPLTSNPTRSGCVCDVGYYHTDINYINTTVPSSYDTQGNPIWPKCTACPPGASCRITNLYWANLGTEPGYWRSSSLSLQFYRCQQDYACAGGDGSGTCASSYTGDLCTQCIEDHYKVAGICSACAISEDNRAGAFAQAIFVLILFATFYVSTFWLVAFFDQRLIPLTESSLIRRAIQRRIRPDASLDTDQSGINHDTSTIPSSSLPPPIPSSPSSTSSPSVSTTSATSATDPTSSTPGVSAPPSRASSSLDINRVVLVTLSKDSIVHELHGAVATSTIGVLSPPSSASSSLPSTSALSPSPIIFNHVDSTLFAPSQYDTVLNVNFNVTDADITAVSPVISNAPLTTSQQLMSATGAGPALPVSPVHRQNSKSLIRLETQTRGLTLGKGRLYGMRRASLLDTSPSMVYDDSQSNGTKGLDKEERDRVSATVASSTQRSNGDALRTIRQDTEWKESDQRVKRTKLAKSARSMDLIAQQYVSSLIYPLI